MVDIEKGGFTLPGEAGYEKLTLEMAKKWGADVIRDSDGTVLSDEITQAGYGIYSTICIIRDHNEWAKNHMDKLQQTFLMSKPVEADTEFLTIHLLNGYFKEQFLVNDSEDSRRYWQVYDRTNNEILSKEEWCYEKEAGNVVIQEAIPFHTYTVNFLAYRIWEEISMYNHVTNNWEKEHLMPIDPRTSEAQEYLYQWMENWCKQHETTTVVRFTSMFYNFVWIWGASEKNRNLFSDWGSYDFTVSPQALDDFEKKYGYALCAEDFINQGKLHVTHMPAKQKQLDYMRFTNEFVVEFGSKLVDLVHKYGKQAYVFYDDSWIGVEPYSDLFEEFHFDGLIKCVFSGYEARLCAGAKTDVHELRLHPYLFPVGLGGAPTFMEGGNPTRDAKQYWNRIRRAILRQSVDRIGLGGYLHLTQDYPDFCDYIEEIGKEFRRLKAMHEEGKVYTLPITVAILHSWGKLRSWSLSGHFHETYMHDLIHINEALSGLPVEVKFINFEDIMADGLSQVDVVINAGRAQTAWSGGENWKNDEVVTVLKKWVYEGGVFIGVNEPSAVEGYVDYFRMAPVLGIDLDTGAKVCHGKWQYSIDYALAEKILPTGSYVGSKDNLFLTDEKTKVIAEYNGVPTMTEHNYGKGKGIYLADFRIDHKDNDKVNDNIRMLLNILLHAKGLEQKQCYITDSSDCECAFYPASRKMVVINNTDHVTTTKVMTPNGEMNYTLEPFATIFD